MHLSLVLALIVGTLLLATLALLSLQLSCPNCRRIGTRIEIDRRGKGKQASLTQILTVGTAILLMGAALASCGQPQLEGTCDPSSVSMLDSASESGEPSREISPPNEASAGDIWISPIDGMRLVFVPSGSFAMGAAANDALAWEDETPQHEIRLNGFWIDQIEVTNSMFAECVEEGACSPPASASSYNRPEYYEDENCGNYPVVNVTWYDAESYCRWADRRLPTEAEWEKAARSDDGRMYPWGNQEPNSELANFCDANCPSDDRTREVDDGYAAEAPSASFFEGRSPFGALNMAGNVWEWVSDWMDTGYYMTSPSSNPMGPADGEMKVLRGGSWLNTPRIIRTTSRHAALPTLSAEGIGFRCVYAPPPEDG